MPHFINPYLLAVAIGVCAAPTSAQTASTAARMITVEGVQMRVATGGLALRKPGQPVVVLEAGSGADLETWQPVFADIATFAPVVAYDRRGVGRSQADPTTPSLTRNVQTLHAVLDALHIPPPYVLVGHSLGGVIVRGFSSLYPRETVGLIYLDTPDFEATRQERASVLPLEDRQRALEPPDLPSIPVETPPALRPVYEQLLLEMRDDYPSARPWQQPAGIPVAVVVTTRSDRLRGNGGALVRLQIKHQAEWTLGSPNSLFVLAGHTGHQVHRDDPALVIRLVTHVLRYASPIAK